jgi:hypothetical protein
VKSPESLELELKSEITEIRESEFLPEQKIHLITLRASLILNNFNDTQLNQSVFIFSVYLIEYCDYQKEYSIIKYFCEIMDYKLSKSR